MLLKLKKKKIEYDELMEKLQREVRMYGMKRFESQVHMSSSNVSIGLT